MKKLLILLVLATSASTYGQSKIIDWLSSDDTSYVPYKNSIDSSFAKCDSTWTNNVEWGQCLGEHEELWQKLMLQFYDSLKSELEPKGKELLKSSQTNWTNDVNSEREF